MSATVDTVVTVVLFVALLPAVAVAAYIGVHLLMLGDGITERGSAWGVWVGVIGVPVSAVSVYLATVALAWVAPGLTFYYPIAALVVGSLLTAGLSAAAHRIARRA